MKILYLHQYFKFPDENGGTRSFDLATGFLKSGHNVEMLTSTSEPIYISNQRWTRIEKYGLIVHYIHLKYSNDMNFMQRSIVFLKFLWFSSLKLISLKGDIVIASSTPLTIGIPALIKKLIHKTPYIFEVRDIWPEVVIAMGIIKNRLLKQILHLLEYGCYKYAYAIVPLSVDMKKSIISRFPELTKKQIVIIENISDINRFQYKYSDKITILKDKIGFKPRFTILYAGTFGRVNGISYVIDLAVRLYDLDPTIVFVLIGNGSEKNIIKEKAYDNKVLNKNIFILDPVSKDELPQLYSECDMGSSFVISIKELWANSANKFFDTLAAAKPILINHKGWQKEIIIKENLGYVLPVTFNENTVKEFVHYTQNKILITKQKINALKIANTNFSTDLVVKKYNNIINNYFSNDEK